MALLKDKFASAKQDWTTPDDLFDKLNREFHFDFDLAASEKNTKCKRFFTKSDDALTKDWNGTCWLNPPYGSTNDKLVDWVIKSFHESKKDHCTVVMLIPARTNTKWWHEYVMKACEVRFICGRPKFGDAIHGLPQPLALIVFKEHDGETKFSSFHMNAIKIKDNKELDFNG